MACGDLYSSLYIATKSCGAAALIVYKCEDSESHSGAGDKGFGARSQLVKKKDYQSDEVIRI